MEKELENLFLHTVEGIQNKELKTIEENLNIFNQMFEIILAESLNPHKSNTLKEWEKYINNIGENLISSGLLEEAKNLVIDLYKVCNKKNTYNLNLEPIISMLLRIIRELDNANKIRVIQFVDILRGIILNSGSYEGNYHDNDAPRFIQMYYIYILKNKKLTEDEKSELIVQIINKILSMSISIITKDEYKLKTLEHVYLYLAKSMVDQYDIHRVNRFIFSENRYPTSAVNRRKIQVIICIYLYYLTYKENLPQPEKERYLQLVTELNLNLQALMNYEGLKIWNYFDEISNELSRWERFLDGENSKWLMMDGVVREFILFVTAANIQYVSINNIEIGEDLLFQFISMLMKDNEIHEEVINNYRKFKKAFGYNTNDNMVYSELSLILEQLLAKYKQIQIERIKSDAKKILLLNENQIILHEAINTSLKTNKLFNIMHHEKQIQPISPKTVLNLIYPIRYFLDKNVLRMYQEEFDVTLRNLIINEMDKNFKIRTLRFRETNKIKSILGIINEVEKEGYKIDAIVNGLNNKSGFLYIEKDEDIEIFNNYLETIADIVKTRQLMLIGFDKSLNLIQISDLDISFRKPTQEEIHSFLERSKNDKDEYEINIVNDINLPFEKNEAFEYVSLGYRVLEIKLGLTLKFTKGSGFIIRPGT
ncbi:hypothetical protein ACDZ29_25450 [Peribacillus sp. RS7]|uniref:hypothetical protein n=1 Tax=Peribacillus sp. RS7 TaxID=3242679 RepID=UPI0035C04B45